MKKVDLHPIASVLAGSIDDLMATHAQMDNLKRTIEEKTRQYQEESMKMERMLNQMKIVNSDLTLHSDIQEALNHLMQVKEHFDLANISYGNVASGACSHGASASSSSSTDVSAGSSMGSGRAASACSSGAGSCRGGNSSLALSLSEMRRGHANYVAKLNACIKLYVTLNQRLLKRLKMLKNDADLARRKVQNVLKCTDVDVKVMERKVERYENELSKLERKYPWIKEESIHLPNINKEMAFLSELKKERAQLETQLNQYHGLKPDIKEATEQLNAMKLQHNEFSS